METAFESQEPEFKTLGDFYDYSESRPNIPEGGPDPRDYSIEDEDSFEKDLADFKKDLADFKQRSAISQVVREALQPQEPGLTPYADDPYGSQRRELESRVADSERKAETAKAKGETREGFTEQDHRDRAAQYFKDLEKLPPPTAQIFEQKQRMAQDEQAVSLTCDPTLADDDNWSNPRVQNDAAVLIAKTNREGRVIRLPQEDSPWGNLLPAEPKNMVVFDLPERQLEAVQRELAGLGSKTPDEEMRTTWAILRRHGFASFGRRAVEENVLPEEEAPKPTRNPDKMTQKEFEAWRNQTTKIKR